MLSGIYAPEEIRFHVQRMAEERGASFVKGAVVRIEPGARILYLDSSDEIGYDVASFNVGSHVPVHSLSLSGGALFPVKPIENLLKARQAILDLVQEKEPALLILGGGPAALEISGNLWRLIRDRAASARITVLAGSKFLSRLPDKVRRLAMESLTRRGIEVVQGAYVREVQDGRAVLEDDRSYPFDMGFVALGVQPEDLFRRSGLATGEDGGLLVNPYLQSVDHPEIFGGGDCISLQGNPLNRVGVYAVRQNPIIYENLMAALEGGQMKPFDPGGPYMLIFNLGDGRGIFWKRNLVWDGRLCFFLKDYIDRKFMRRFQVSGELNERAGKRSRE
jgi:NADH dehydrogenase FAD-containing subunit